MLHKKEKKSDKKNSSNNNDQNTAPVYNISHVTGNLAVINNNMGEVFGGHQSFFSEKEVLENKLSILVRKILQHDQFGIDRQEQQYYIAVQGCQLNQYSNSFELYNNNCEKPGEANKFLENDKKVFLVLGNAGAGKTMFFQYFFLQLKERYQKENDPLVLYIMLGTIEDPSTQLIEKHLKRIIPNISTEEIELLKKNKEFIFILDGYDEIAKGLYQNLYAMNKLSEWKAKKVFISCRSSYLLNVPDYRRHFFPFQHAKAEPFGLMEVNLVPFSDGQIDAYIEKFLQSPPEELGLEGKWRNPDIYHNYIERLPGLRVLLSTPFLLRILMEALPKVVAAYESTLDNQLILTESKIYDYFIASYFERQANKLAARGRLPTDGSDIMADFQAFSEQLAQKMWNEKRTYIIYKRPSALFSTQEEHPYEYLLGNSNENMVKVREGCPIKQLPNEETNEIQFAFLNYVLQIYFVSRAMFQKELERNTSVTSKTLPVRTTAVSPGFFQPFTTADNLPPLMTEEEIVQSRWVEVRSRIQTLAKEYYHAYSNIHVGNELIIALSVSEEPQDWNNLSGIQQILKELEGYFQYAMKALIVKIKISENKLILVGENSESMNWIKSLLQDAGFQFTPSFQIEKKL
jgi:hypothetical protein